MKASTGDRERLSRQEEAAHDLEEAAAELAAFIEQCPDSGWRKTSSSEGWTVAALAYHCALGNDVALGWICQMLAGREVYETPDTHNAFNSRDSTQHAEVTKSEAIDALRRSAGRTAQFLRSLDDGELERSALLGVASREMTVGQFIPNFARHVRLHTGSMRESIAG